MTSPLLPALTARRSAALLLVSTVAGCTVDSREVEINLPPGYTASPGDGMAGASGGPSPGPAAGGAGDPSMGASENDAPGAIGSGVATRLVFNGLPESGLVGTPLDSFTVRLEDEAGNVVRQSGSRVWLALEGGPSEAQWVGFSSTETLDGVATFDAVGIDRPGTYQLSATAALLGGAASASVEVAAPAFVSVSTNIPDLPAYSVWAATHEILYASTSEGVYRSDNVGASWTLATFGVRGAVGVLRGSSAEPERVYTTPGGAVTGSPSIGNALSPVFMGRTLDRGRTWRTLSRPSFDAGQVLAVALDDARPNLAWACTESGVYATEDSGDHWAATPFAGECGAIVFGGPAPGALYAYHADDSSRSLMKSDNDGASWQTLMSIFNPLTELVAAPSGTVYAVSSPELLRSDDAGATWSGASVDVRKLAIAPSNPDRMYGISRQLVRVSLDGGATFDAGTDMRPGTVYELSVDPSDPLRVYAATSQGLVVSTDGAATWAPPSTGLAGTTDVVAHPTQPGRFLAAGGPLFQSDDSGDSWVRLENGPAFAGRIAFHPEDPNIAYTCGSNFYESRDGAESWAQIATGYACNALAIAGSTIWMANSEGVERSLDGGVTWATTGLDQPTFSLAADPAGGTVYAVTNAGAYKSIDSGDTWAPMFTADRAGEVALDPTRSSRLWVTTCAGGEGGPLRLSVNSGDTWSTPLGFPDTSPFGCASSLQFASSGALYVFGAELYVSRDGGTTWSASPDSGIRRLSRERFAISPDEGTLFVATERGLFRSSRAGF